MLTNPCDFNASPVNTGIECSAAMGVTAGYIFVPASARWTQADIDASPYNGNFRAFVEAKMHESGANRWYPVFGNLAPIADIQENNESDVVETLANGATIYIRPGMVNRTILTTEGGLCFASHLVRFPRGYTFLELDNAGQVLMYEPEAGVYGGMPANLIKGLAPVLATFTTTYKNRLMISYNPEVYAQYGKIFTLSADDGLLSLNGLMDSVVNEGTSTQTTTNIFVEVETECAGTDLVELLPASGSGSMAQITNFVVTNAATGAPVTITAVLKVAASGNTPAQVRLTGTFVSATSYLVNLAAPSVLYTNGVEGYEGKAAATVTIP